MSEQVLKRLINNYFIISFILYSFYYKNKFLHIQTIWGGIRPATKTHYGGKNKLAVLFYTHNFEFLALPFQFQKYWIPTTFWSRHCGVGWWGGQGKTITCFQLHNQIIFTKRTRDQMTIKESDWKKLVMACNIPPY